MVEIAVIRRAACGIELSFLVEVLTTVEAVVVVRIASVGAGLDAAVLLVLLLLVAATEARTVLLVVPGLLATVECI